MVRLGRRRSLTDYALGARQREVGVSREAMQ